ncbi:hypothetical protein LCGC14_2244120 [marine sediment metagenome]|uniref:Uncharacterized protein n=1 Tax=marine sediment metagenome TaxID=412755 RepID=A0A0F9DS57_9ZZZZ
MEHTPGPLRVTFTNIPGTDSRQWYVIDSNGDEVAASPVGPHAFNAANARLIAAAPELLKALERITAAIEHNQIAAATLLAEKARTAIKAARKS